VLAEVDATQAWVSALSVKVVVYSGPQSQRRRQTPTSSWVAIIRFPPNSGRSRACAKAPACVVQVLVDWRTLSFDSHSGDRMLIWAITDPPRRQK
jgi:hypothetical protein